MKLFKKIHNFFFCLKYPFWKARNVFTGKFCGYSFTWYDDIPEGWQKAFGKKLSDEIKAAGKQYLKAHKKSSWKDILQWEQIKEKYGTLRLYAATTSEIEHILQKYELLSMCYCIDCGKPVRYRTSGYIEYLCKECGEKYIKEDQLDYCRVTKEDIPELCNYAKNSTEEIPVDLKEKYGIDFKELWGIEE